MKANELMVGDWIKLESYHCKFIQLTAIDETYNSITYFDADAEGELTLQLTAIKPIPLTPEILEKNGFHWGCTASEEDFCGAVGCGYPDSGWCFDEGAGEIKIIFPNETDGGLVRLDDQNGDRHLEIVFVEPLMVHELQHALRLCGISLDRR